MNYHTLKPHTAVSDETIHWYLQDLVNMPVLTFKMEQKVIQQIVTDPLSKEADDARHLLIKANLRFVVHLARRYQPLGPELADLIQEGNLALVKAAQQFDPRRSQHFKPFAMRRVCWVLFNMVEEHLRERHLLEPGTEPVHPLHAQVLKALAHHAIDEQALVCDLPEGRFLSLHVLLEEDDAILIDESSSSHPLSSNEALPDEIYLMKERRNCIAESLQVLPPKERLVLICRYMLDITQTLEAVGKALGISRERGRQLEVQGIQKLRHPRLSKTLFSML